ncbi:penicillin-binding protein 2 [Hathewaya proteolytica DSM 3090]|uniref:Penicillin-binding protein 2 n=1 Tax=Hathewaya proteolytica DSM 3090 TaxID=1121331 RepID=A0A1M6JK90_9CLOT|nr:penicillin-binding transpeptidase domain-containing protein [Hathewaya proteolytica]SHJ47130.1 penicillin-binding protein 2 [Hathewaya proteolytica DSM 3090]
MKNRKKKKKQFNRYTTFVIIMIFIFGAIISKTFYLQIIRGPYYSAKASNRSHSMLTTAAPRGEIFDINGELLATNRQSYTLMFNNTEESLDKFYDTIDKVYSILEEHDESIDDDFPLKVNPVRFEFNASSEESLKWLENRFKKDRDIHVEITRKTYEDKKYSELNEEQKKVIEDKLSKFTAEETFNYMICQDGYRIYDVVKKDYIDESWKMQSDKSMGEEQGKNEIAKYWNKLKKEEKLNYLKSKYDDESIRKYLIIKDKIKMHSFSNNSLANDGTTLASDLPKEVAYVFEQLQTELPGISISKQPIREYPNGELGSSFIGYIRKINSYEKGKYEEKGYNAYTDYIGAAGIEKEYEDILAGNKGQLSVEKNKLGRASKTLGEQVAYPGSSIQLTIDKNLQAVAEKALDDELEILRKLGNLKPDGRVDDANKTNATRGAAVVQDVNTGAVLALVSRPGYDPNIFTTGQLSPEDYERYFNPDLEKFGREYIKNSGLLKLTTFADEDISALDNNKKMEYLLNKIFPIDKRIPNNTTVREDLYDLYPKPFYNYATKSLIPPGSTFKPVTGLAGLEEGVITPSTRIYDAGPYNKRYKQFQGASWMYNLYRGSHGSQNLAEALRDSNNYYMYEVADRLFEKGGVETKEGLNGLAKYAWKLGLGADPDTDPVYSTGIEIDESFGQVYNYESGKTRLSVMITQSLYDYLKKGKASIAGITYKGIDIIPYNNESEKINKIKVELTNAIKAEMASNKNGYVSPKIKELLKSLIDASPELKKNNYSEKDISNMMEAIQSSVNDARNEIKSGANAYNASIGQGLNSFTPLQLSNYVATLVNGGIKYKVHIVNKIMDPDGNVLKDYSKEPQILSRADFNKGNVEEVKKGMKDVTSDGGTASTAFKNFPIHSGGKTGSATYNVKQDEIGRTAYGNFVGFAPYEKPEIAVSVVLFDGGHGGYAAEVAKAIYEEYFKEDIYKLKPSYKFKYPDLGKQLAKENVDDKVNSKKTGGVD